MKVTEENVSNDILQYTGIYGLKKYFLSAFRPEKGTIKKDISQKLES
jgi:hypothetical protein